MPSLLAASRAARRAMVRNTSSCADQARKGGTAARSWCTDHCARGATQVKEGGGTATAGTGMSTGRGAQDQPMPPIGVRISPCLLTRNRYLGTELALCWRSWGCDIDRGAPASSAPT